MLMVYILTMPWFLLIGKCYIDSLDPDYDASPFWLSIAVGLWPITAAILAGVQLADFFNKKQND